MPELWTGDFGNDYTKRNTRETVQARQRVWEMLLPANCCSVLEVGANIGLNLEAIAEFSEADLYATEPNELARDQLQISGVISPNNITGDTADKLRWPDNHVDVALTCGVLIHVPPDKLQASMREIHRVAAKWVICAEYFAPSEEMIPYRGHNDALWRRDYGGLYLDAFPDLHCIANFFAWKRLTGLDNLMFWVFEKGAKRH